VSQISTDAVEKRKTSVSDGNWNLISQSLHWIPELSMFNMLS
jgi:hypothetical protein